MSLESVQKRKEELVETIEKAVSSASEIILAGSNGGIEEAYLTAMVVQRMLKRVIDPIYSDLVIKKL